MQLKMCILEGVKMSNIYKMSLILINGWVGDPYLHYKHYKWKGKNGPFSYINVMRNMIWY